MRDHRRTRRTSSTGNYLSTDARIPVTLLRTNVCSPLATNALGGNIWDNFSSDSYKTLPSVGKSRIQDPFTGACRDLRHAGRRARLYARAVADLVVVDRAVPAQQHRRPVQRRSLGRRGACASFDASIEQMLWPEKREHDPVLGDKVAGMIDRTRQRRSYLFVPVTLRPGHAGPRSASDGRSRLFPSWSTQDGDIVIGPIPKGMPVNLLANLQPLSRRPGTQSDRSGITASC